MCRLLRFTTSAGSSSGLRLQAKIIVTVLCRATWCSDFMVCRFKKVLTAFHRRSGDAASRPHPFKHHFPQQQSTKYKLNSASRLIFCLFHELKKIVRVFKTPNLKRVQNNQNWFGSKNYIGQCTYFHCIAEL